MTKILSISVTALIVLITGCCKSDNCFTNAFPVQPFLEKRTAFQCNNNDEYTYIFRKKAQIDSLSPTCFTTSPIAFPVEENNMLYIIVGRLSYYKKDTIGETYITKDSCARKVFYEVNMLQRDTNLAANGQGAVMSVFCSLENVPPDYEVEVKHKYVPIQ